MSSCILRVVLIAIACTPCVAFAESDDELIGTLASASAYAEINAAMDAIRERLSAGQPSQQFLDELMRVATTNPEVAKRAIDSVLLLVREQAPYSEQSLVYIAVAIGGGLRIYRYQSLMAVLTSNEVQPISDAVFDTLMRNLEGPSGSLSIDVLTAIPLSDSRSAQVGEAFRRIWERDDSTRYQKAKVIEKMALIYNADTMPAAIVDSLVDIAMTESSILPRVAALEVISLLPIDSARSDELGRSLSAYFLQPQLNAADEEYIAAPERMELRSRMAISLLELLDAPYPNYVVELWIMELSTILNEAQTAAIQSIVSAQPLTDDQFTQLTRILNTGPSYMRPQHPVLDLEFVPISNDELEYADNAFRSSFDVATKVQAGYRLLLHYGANSVPTTIADVAADYLKGESENGLLPVSLYLVNNAVSEEERYTELLVEAAARYANDFRAHKMYLSTFLGRNTDSLVLRYAADERQPERFRSEIVSMAGMHLEDGDPLTPEVADLLENIARHDDSTLLVQSAGRVLKAHGATTPMRVTLTDRDFQGAVLGFVFLAMLVINAITFIVGMISAMTMPGGSTKVVVGRLFLWTFLSFGMLVVLVLGFVGFIGHNSAPPPSYSLAMNIPAYIGTVIYVSVAWRWLRRARGRDSLRRAQGTTFPNP